jgi:protein SCO1/2
VKRILAGLAIAGALFAAGCDSQPKTPFNGVDVTGSDVGRELRLNDFNGKPRTLDEFRGKVILVTFGYTQCPDVCPTTLQDLNLAIKKLGADASRVQVLFVTVDPKRDKPELLRQYVPAFNPSFIGLYGDDEATKKVEGEFKIYAAERPGKTPDTYTVDHSAQTYAYDPQGRLRLVIGYGFTPDAMASDLRLLLNTQG